MLRQARSERFRRWVVPCGLAVAAVFGPGLVQCAQLSVTQWRLDRRLAALRREQEQLQQEQQRLTKDTVYLEGLIRSTFKLSKPGEYVIELPADRRR